MNSITSDALKAISEQLSPASRLKLAGIDQRCFEVATKWHDVKTILFDDEDVTIAGANFVHNYENSSFREEGMAANGTQFKTEARETAINLCPGLKKLIIQTKLTDSDVVMLNKLNLKLTKLYISTQNLSLVNFPKFEKLKTLHLAYNSSKNMEMVEVVEPRVLEVAFPSTLQRICLTGIYLTEDLVTTLATLPNLKTLDLIGCLVDTKAGAKYIPVLETFRSLQELSLPPSMFSFSVEARTPKDLTLRNLKVTKIGIYMDQFDGNLFYSQTRNFLPKDLKTLAVFGNYMPLRKWNMMWTVKKFNIIFGPNTSLASCPQAGLTNVRLLSHMVRDPPYNRQEHKYYNSEFRHLRDRALLVFDNLDWRFSLIDWKDNFFSREDVKSLLRRMNALMDEEVVFEGVRIAVPFIRERDWPYPLRIPVSPNEPQVLVPFIPQAPPLPAPINTGVAPPPPPPPAPSQQPQNGSN